MLEADLIVGADGAGSVVRQSLEALKCCQSVTEPLGHAYKELELPPLQGRHALDPGALHIWPRGGEMAIALPNPDGTFTGTLFVANETFDRLQNEAEARDHLQTHYHSMLQHVPDFDKQWSKNPVGFLGTLRVDQWHHGNTVLIGDAAHAIVPFYGQGMNAAFEDVRRLDELHAAGVNNLPEVLFQERKPNADAIAEMALMNFVEMRDHVGDPMFLNRKALERKLGRWIPKMFTPCTTECLFQPALCRRGSVMANAKTNSCGVSKVSAWAGRILRHVGFDLPALYLELDQLLDLQHVRSDPAEHDEMLFIVIHQVYELWFKLLLHELEKVESDFLTGAQWGAHATLGRCRTILKTLVGQLDILETMTPRSFNSFRERLETSSGFQSVQFREIETFLGYKRPGMLEHWPEHLEGLEQLKARLAAPTLRDAFHQFWWGAVRRSPKTFSSETSRNPPSPMSGCKNRSSSCTPIDRTSLACSRP